MLTSRSRSGSVRHGLEQHGLVKLKIRILRPIPSQRRQGDGREPGRVSRRRRANPIDVSSKCPGLIRRSYAWNGPCAPVSVQ